MKRFQYIMENDAGHQDEIWVCESCRRENNDSILEGKWRLTGRSDNSDIPCARCHKKKEGKE